MGEAWGKAHIAYWKDDEMYQEVIGKVLLTSSKPL